MPEEYIKCKELLSALEIERANLTAERKHLEWEKDVYTNALNHNEFNLSCPFLFIGTVLPSFPILLTGIDGFLQMYYPDKIIGTPLISHIPTTGDIILLAVYAGLDIAWITFLVKYSLNNKRKAKESIEANEYEKAISKVNDRINEINSEYEGNLKERYELEKKIAEEYKKIKEKIVDEYIEYCVNIGNEPDYSQYSDMIEEYNEKAKEEKIADEMYLRKAYQEN